MSIYGEITRITDNFSDAYDMCSIKGATMPTSANQNSNNLPATVLTIPAEGYGDMLDNYIMASINIIETDAATVKDNAFNDDILIKEVKLNAATEIGKAAFYQCSELTSISMPNVTTIRLDGLMGCTKLTDIYAPNVTSLENSAIRNCTSLVILNLPKVRQVDVSNFSGCTSLEELYCPELNNNGGMRFSESLRILDLGNLSGSGVGAFPYLTDLPQFRTLILRRSQVCILPSIDRLSGTPFRNGTGGTVYVPRSLVTDYSTATEWKDLESATFAAIEDMT